jgi:ligand-binding SRPBCC domain-containing protein
MPSAQRARIDKLQLVPPARPAPEQIQSRMAGLGSLISLSWRPLPPLPIRIRWLAEIIEFRVNDAFTDRQVRGPFRYWLHKHRVRAVGDRGGPGVTVLTDEIDYELPFGILGTLSHYFVHHQLEKAFAYRREHIGAALERMMSVPKKPASELRAPLL